MNIKTLREGFHQFDEGFLIEKETSIMGISVLIAGIFREENKLVLYLFSEGEDSKKLQNIHVKMERKRRKGTLTKREELLMGLQNQNGSILEVVRGILVNGKEYQLRSGAEGGMEEYNIEGRLLLYYFLFQGISFGFLEEQKLSKIQCAQLELEGEYEKMPFSKKDIKTLEFVLAPRHYHIFVGRKIKVSLGKQIGRKQKFFCNELQIEIEYYINNIRLVDYWSEAKEKFDRMLTDGVLTSQKEYKMFLNYLQEVCPQGMRNLVVEYECDRASLEFYTKEQLKETVKISKEATAFFLTGNVSSGTGIHGKKLKSCLISYPVNPDTQEVTLELLQAFVQGDISGVQMN